MTTTPSADQVYGALVEGESIWPDLEPWAESGVRELRISRYPLQPRLVVKTLSEAGVPCLDLYGETGRVTVELHHADLQRGHVVTDGTWHPIEASASAEILQLLETEGASLGPIRSLKSFLAFKRCASQGFPLDDSTTEVAISAVSFAPTTSEDPEGVHATLYPYQLAGWRWLRFLVAEQIGGVLADEMGLGKTLQIISLLSDPGRELGSALICAPGSILENWRRELFRFAPALRVLKHHGALRTGRPKDLAEYDVVITSYDTVMRDNSLLQMIEWGVVVLDEAQYIRNPHAQRTRAVKKLPRRSGIAVTGTPVENRLLDLWSILDFAMPGYLADASAFVSDFHNNPDGATKVEPLVSPLMLRRRLTEVATDLPDRIVIPQVVELEHDEAAAYDRIRRLAADEYGSGATLVALTTLRQFCAHPFLLDPANRADPSSFTKFRRLEEILEEVFERGEKVIVFTSYTLMADIIAERVGQLGSFSAAIDGRLAIDKRQPLIDEFSAVSGAAALVLNPHAGGAGLNITAANHVIHYNLEWNPALEDQASARAYRRGQDRPVTVHRLFVAGTVEETINNRLARKRALSETAVIGVEGKDEDYSDIVAALNRSPLASENL